MRPVWPRWLRRRSPGGYRCTRRNCQVRGLGWPVDRVPLSDGETARWEVLIGAEFDRKAVEALNRLITDLQRGTP